MLLLQTWCCPVQSRFLLSVSCVCVCVCVSGPRKFSSQKGHFFFFFFFKNEVCVPTGFPGGSVVKNLPANAGDTDPLEKEMAIHSSILAWEIPWTEESGGLQSMGSQNNQIRFSD